MEGLGLDNMLGAEEVERMFSNQGIESEVEDTQTDTESDKKETEQTAEVDFSDLLGNQSESVGSERTTEGNRETPKSNNDIGAPEQNLFFSIAKALRDEGVFPDLSEDTLKDIKDAEGFRKLFDDQISSSLTERQKRIEEALNGGASNDEVLAYQNDMQILDYLEQDATQNRLEQENEDGETLRKQVMYQDYINRGFSDERAKKLVNKSFEAGTEIDDAKEAFQSCKELYKNKIEGYKKEVEDRRKNQREAEEKEFNALKKQIVDTDSFFDGVKIDKNVRQKAYDLITKPVYKDESGQYLTGLQKYQRENPMEFMKNVALMYSLTDGFKSIEKLTKSKVNAGLKKGFAELESALNNTRRNSDGTLNFANSAPDDDRENWTLAI